MNILFAQQNFHILQPVMTNDNDQPTIALYSEFSDEKQKINKGHSGSSQ